MSKIILTTGADSLLAKNTKATKKLLVRQNKTPPSANAKTGTNKSLGSSGSTSSRSSSLSSCSMATQAASGGVDGCAVGGIDFDDFTANTSIMEFLRREHECDVEYDTESIFQEVSRLTDNSDSRSVEEILREAELLMQEHTITATANNRQNGKCRKRNKQNAAQTFKKNTAAQQQQEQQPQQQQQNTIKMNDKFTKKINNVCSSDEVTEAATTANQNKTTSPINTKNLGNNSDSVPTPQTPHSSGDSHFTAFVDNLPSESVLSEVSTPKDLHNCTVTTTTTDNGNNMTYNKKNEHNAADDTDEGTDTMEEITAAIETIELIRNKSHDDRNDNETYNITTTNVASLTSTVTRSNSISTSMSSLRLQQQTQQPSVNRRYSGDFVKFIPNQTHRASLNFNATQDCSPCPKHIQSCSTFTTSGNARDDIYAFYDKRRSQSPESKIIPSFNSSSKVLTSRSTNVSPKHLVNAVTSPIKAITSITREHCLKNEIEILQEKLKDTEERLQSMRIQYDSLSQIHRDLRENSSQLHEESELLKLDVQHLNDCANILRSELQAAREDRNVALEMQKQLRMELEDSRQDKKRAQELKEKDTKTIIDLQRQCREMERILVRKHPDSVSALIVASKSIGKGTSSVEQESRKLLEQRIAQLEADAKEQDEKAQQILANVQARFNTVQSKYETHIADLETQVLSLQEINTKLNEKIESQMRTQDYLMSKKAEMYYNNFTQTDESILQPPSISIVQDATKSVVSTQTIHKTRDHSTNTIGGLSVPSNQQHQHSQLTANSSTSSTANSTPNSSRPGSKQSGIRKPMPHGSHTALHGTKLPVSQSDSPVYSAGKEDAHLLAIIRGMRVDLAIKDKAMQRLSRELDECKKTIRKLQKEKDISKSERNGTLTHSSSTTRRYSEKSSGDQHLEQSLREAQNKIKSLESDYKMLHNKRLQDLKTLQTAHERELVTCRETVRVLQQRFNENSEPSVMQKRRKLPVDYYALKAKVSSLERRHSDREDRLHMLVEALSKGRLNGALEDLLTGDNTIHKNQQ